MYFLVDVNSVNTGVELRDKHLRSADFLDGDQFSSMTFQSTSLTKNEK